MKKALMVMGLAMVSTMAFAQTSHRAEISRVRHDALMKSGNDVAAVDYKGSIFTKDADTIHTFRFSEDEWSEMTKGTLNATAQVNDTTIGNSWAHAQTSYQVTWNRIEDTMYCNTAAFQSDWQQTYNGVRVNLSWMGPAYVGDNNGFALMSMQEADGTGAINAYMEFPAVEIPAGTSVIDIRMIQLYRCFNGDQCFVDYKVGNKWFAREINVRGVDCDVNSWAAVRPTYTMPLSIASQSSLTIRLRWASNNNAGGVYGYYWVVDNLAIVSGESHRLKAFAQNYIDGAYGIMPQNMKIPLSWMAQVANTGSENISGTNIILQHANPGDTVLSDVSGATFPQNTFAAGDPEQLYYVSINERGVLDSLGLGAWYSYLSWEGSSYIGTNNVPANYKSIPVSTLGENFIATAAVQNDIDTIGWSAILYNVTGSTMPEATSTPINGYRWGHDNGVVGAGNGWHRGFINRNGQNLLTDEGAYNEPGYRLALRYTTPSEIPANWVLKGIEIVTSTDSADQYMEGAQIMPIAYEIDYNDFGYFSSLETGFSSTTPYEVTEDDFDESAYEFGGYSTYADGSYYSVNLNFPNQPELKPNTSYYLGYQTMTASNFAPAVTSSYYRDENGNYQYVPNRYTSRFTPDGYDILLRDPVAGVYSASYAMNEDEFPMIRAIVGPRAAGQMYTVYANCAQSGETAISVENSLGEEMCGDQEGRSYYAGASAYFFIVPADSHTVIDRIVIDGTEYYTDNDENLPANMAIESQQYNVTNPANPNEYLLERSYYVLYIENISSDVTIGATSHFANWGIDPVAENIFVGVQPNPATSQVKVSVSGVSGKVNCSIIDMSGRVVYSKDMNAESVQNIDLNGFARGAYFVRITNDTFSKVEKLIVR